MKRGAKARLRVVLVTHFFPVHGGGIEVVAGQLTSHLLEQDSRLSIEWFASGGDALPERRPGLWARPMPAWNGVEKAMGVPIPLWSPGAMWRLWRAIRRCDVLHIHDFAYPSNIAAVLFARSLRKPYIVTQHIGLVPFKSALLRGVMKLANATAGRYVLGGAAKVVFISQEVRNYFSALPTQQTMLIPNGVDSQTFRPVSTERRREIREQLGIEPSRPLLLFVGRFVEKKGIPLLVQLTQRIPEADWIFAGQGPLDPTESLPPHARVLKGRRGAAIAELFQAADLLVLPSLGEGFPLVVQEALASGTPVLVEDALREALPGVALWLWTERVDGSGDVERWEASLRRALERFPEEEAARNERAAFASATWSWSDGAAAYLKLFEQARKLKG